jgi:hypothetical protein
MSANDIDKGSRRGNQIAKELGKFIASSRGCPHLFGLAEITGPLSQFQAARSNRSETLELLTAIHSTFDLAARPSDDRLEEAFAMWWGNLDEALQSIYGLCLPF